MFGTVSPFYCPVKLFGSAPFFFSSADFCFLEEIPLQDALGETISVSLDL